MSISIWRFPRLEGAQVGHKPTTYLSNSHILYGEFINRFEPGYNPRPSIDCVTIPSSYGICTQTFVFVYGQLETPSKSGKCHLRINSKVNL